MVSLNQCTDAVKGGKLPHKTGGHLLRFYREFPGGLVVRIWGFHLCAPSSISGLGTEISHQATAKKKKIIIIIIAGKKKLGNKEKQISLK